MKTDAESRSIFERHLQTALASLGTAGIIALVAGVWAQNEKVAMLAANNIALNKNVDELKGEVSRVNSLLAGMHMNFPTRTEFDQVRDRINDLERRGRR